MSAESTWVPLSRSGQPEAVALHEGVPGWLRQSLWDWVRACIRKQASDRHSYYSTETLRRLERRLRIERSWSSGASGAVSLLADTLAADETLFLDVVDALLDDIYAPPSGRSGTADRLERALLEGGSAWRVARRRGRYRLERRVDETVTAAAEGAMDAPGAAGAHLAKAWTEAYGRSPDPSAAYGHAVKAVEAAAKPVVLPADDKATLGKMVPALRDKPQKWDVVLAAAPDFDRVAVVRLMAELLLQGQTDRHGEPDQVPVEQEQAEAAVHLAALLVRWFTAGAIWRQAN
jgi:hypothetical protein